MITRRIRSEPNILNNTKLIEQRRKTAPGKIKIGLQRLIEERKTKNNQTRRKTKSSRKKTNTNIIRKVYSAPIPSKQTRKKSIKAYKQPNCTHNNYDKTENCYLGPISYECLKKNVKDEIENTVENPNKKNACYDRATICKWFAGRKDDKKDPLTQKVFKDLDKWLDKNCGIQEYINIFKEINKNLNETKKTENDNIHKRFSLEIIEKNIQNFLDYYITYLKKNKKNSNKEVSKLVERIQKNLIIILENLVKIKDATIIRNIFRNRDSLDNLVNLTWNSYFILFKNISDDEKRKKILLLFIKLHYLIRIVELYLEIPLNEIISGDDLPLTNYEYGFSAIRKSDKIFFIKHARGFESIYRINGGRQDEIKKDIDRTINRELIFYLHSPVAENLYHDLRYRYNSSIRDDDYSYGYDSDVSEFSNDSEEDY